MSRQSRSHGRNIKLLVLAVVSIALTAVAFSLPPLAQDPAYHRFADQRTIFGIPHFWNVITNLPFLLVGVAGIAVCARRTPRGGIAQLRPAYLTFFVGVTLVGLGSGLYHLSPSNATLVWDRLPIVVAVMALFAAVVGESVSTAWGRRLLWPLVIAGICAVLYWYVSEGRGAGDLRAYALAQYLPIVLIPLVLLMHGSALTGVGYLWAILVTYALAKLAEHLDAGVFVATGFISGHSIKHLLSGLATFWLLLALLRRRPVNVVGPGLHRVD